MPETSTSRPNGHATNGAAEPELVYFDHSPRSVALVAMGPSTVGFLAETLTQELTPEWADEIWAINMAANGVWHDLVFWMDDLTSQQAFRPGLIELLKRRGKPVITSRRDTAILPNSYDYPIAEVIPIALRHFATPYLNNGVAMAIAYAIVKRVQLLRIYGADFTYPDRAYAESGRACVESWVMVARESGMDVRLTPSTSLFDVGGCKGVYGYAAQPEFTMPDGTVAKYISDPNAPPPQTYVAENAGHA